MDCGRAEVETEIQVKRQIIIDEKEKMWTKTKNVSLEKEIDVCIFHIFWVKDGQDVIKVFIMGVGERDNSKVTPRFCSWGQCGHLQREKPEEEQVRGHK